MSGRREVARSGVRHQPGVTCWTAPRVESGRRFSGETSTPTTLDAPSVDCPFEVPPGATADVQDREAPRQS